jgi:protein gp37
MTKTKIEWATDVWNVTSGCSPIMTGCRHCWAKEMHRRLRAMGQPKYDHDFGEVRCHPSELEKPLHWRKPRRVFVDSMSDLFHDKVPASFIVEVFGVMAVAGGGFQNLRPYTIKEPPSDKYPNGVMVIKNRGVDTHYGPHVFQLLTKRISRARNLLTSPQFRENVSAAAYRRAHDRTDAGYLSDCISAKNRAWAPGRAGRKWPLPNVHLGYSASTQDDLERGIEDLLATPAAVRWLSLEPLVGPVRFDWCEECNRHGLGRHGSDQPDEWGDERECGPSQMFPPINWVVVGCESGPNARPMELDWARSIVEQCKAAGVPVFVKQLQIDGKLSKNPDEWPEDLRVREYPNA